MRKMKGRIIVSGGKRKKNESYNVNPVSHTKFLTLP
jgi:hypothetical protein